MRASKFLSIIVFFGLLLSLAFGCKKDPPKVIPIISTASITDITSSTAISGGIIKSDGNSPITSKGICWSTNPNPTIIDNKTSDGSGITNFTSSITQLSPGVTYYLRAYATNSVGTGYGNEISFNSSAIIPSVTTSAITDITPETAMGGGSITNDGGSSVIAHGVCWSTHQTPTITESKTISDTLGITYISNIIDLEQGTTYYVRAYATSNVGTGYGNVVSFTSAIRSVDSDFKPLGLIFETVEELLAIPTDEFYTPMGPITKSSELNTQLGVPHPGKQRGNACVGWALGYGMMSYLFNSVEGYNDYNADYKVFSPYFIWNQQREKKGSINIDAGISISDALELVQDQGCCKVSDMNMPNDMSYLTILPSAKAKINAANYIITSYQRCFTFDLEKFKSYISKDKVPLVIGLCVDAAFQKNATKQFETIDGRLVWTKYDNKWFQKNPKYNHAVLICGFDDNINAFKVLNSWGTDWGQDGYFWLDYDFAKTAIRSIGSPKMYYIFVAHVKRPLIQTKSVTNITSFTAKSGGTEIKDWGIYTIEKGVCWSTDPKPTISHNKIKYGAGLGDFICSITGLSPQTTYYVSAYAINAQGVSYGVPEKFTTLSIQTPTVKTMAVTTYSASSATVGGTVTEDGGATITERGVYWGTNPLINSIKLQIGNGIGSFSTSLTGLNPSTTYYIRAYATNSVGTAYGTQENFKTAIVLSLATVTTATATNITTSEATLGGNVIADVNAEVTEKGVYYSTSSNPKLTGTKVSSGKGGTGSFTINVSNLSPDKTYYVQAYAINSVGRAYGSEISFNTDKDMSDIVNIPDPAFKSYCTVNFDTNGDGEIQKQEATNVTNINVFYRGIKSMEGIEYFTTLKELECSGNTINSLDVSKNTLLVRLSCYGNRLSGLDVSKNTLLTKLFCFSNQLTSLDISKNRDLTHLICSSNPINSLDVSEHTSLIELSCYGNKLTTIDVRKSTGLTKLLCGDNQLTSLDVSSNTVLTELNCSRNQLTSLDVSSNSRLADLECNYNGFTSLDVSRNVSLSKLFCGDNQITSLDVSKNIALTYLLCESNKLTSLDVSKNTALTNIACYYNQLTTIDLSANKYLKEFSCGVNQLTSLDVSENSVLDRLNCLSNPNLTELWMKNGQSISNIWKNDYTIIYYKP